jgi:hypothetical protein
MMGSFQGSFLRRRIYLLSIVSVSEEKLEFEPHQKKEFFGFVGGGGSSEAGRPKHR